MSTQTPSQTPVLDGAPPIPSSVNHNPTTTAYIQAMVIQIMKEQDGQ